MKKNKKLIIVSGANGYVGKYVLLELIKHGYDIIALKFDHSQSIIINNPKVKYVYCDITNIDRYKKEILKEINHQKLHGIIHLAAIVGETDYQKNYKVNTIGTKNMIELAKKCKTNRFIYLSSACTLKRVKSPYAKTKKLAEQLVQESGLQYTIFIPAMILGVEGLGINQILKNTSRLPFITPVIGSGKQTQHPVYVKDLAHIIVYSLNNRNSFEKIYQIAEDEIIQLKEFLKIILNIEKKKTLFIHIPSKIMIILGKIFERLFKNPPFTSEQIKEYIQYYTLDTSKVKKDLNFNPTPLKEILKEILNKSRDYDYYIKPRKEITINFLF